VDGNLDDPHSLDAYLAGMRNIDMVREVTMSGEATVLPKPVLSVCVP
jgi:hypothetical protein